VKAQDRGLGKSDSEITSDHQPAQTETDRGAKAEIWKVSFTM
jgi:hypothetical protein